MALNNKKVGKLIEQLQEEVEKDGGVLFVGLSLSDEEKLKCFGFGNPTFLQSVARSFEAAVKDEVRSVMMN